MSDDPRLLRAFDLIRKVIADSYKRGADDAREQVIEAAARSTGIEPRRSRAGFDDVELQAEQNGAPREIVRELIDRTLAEYAPQGVNVAGIYGCRRDGPEEMISLPSIRAELRKGLIDGRYRLDKCCWFLRTPPRVAAR